MMTDLATAGKGSAGCETGGAMIEGTFDGLTVYGNR